MKLPTGLIRWILVIGISLGGYDFVIGDEGANNPEVGIHGMLLVGSEHTYISHLPMFDALHGYQFIAEVELYKRPKENTDLSTG